MRAVAERVHVAGRKLSSDLAETDDVRAMILRGARRFLAEHQQPADDVDGPVSPSAFRIPK